MQREGELWRMGACETAIAVASGEISAAEVVAAHLGRIESINPQVNAVTQVLERTAIEAGEDIDRRRNAGEALPTLAGVPFTVKSNIDVFGSPTNFGIGAMRDAMPSHDAPAIRRLRAAGAIPIARTNLPDMSLRFHTASELFGDTINPWNSAYSPGGSSGGEAVAIATGMASLGLGNDAGGSIRAPAQFAGVAGLKPTPGRIPNDRSVGLRDPMLASAWFAVEGLFARAVKDLSLAYEVVAGADVCDPRTNPVPLRTAAPLRRQVAVSTDPGGGGIDPTVKAAIANAAAKLEDAGFEVSEAEPVGIGEAAEGFERMTMAEFGVVWPHLAPMLSPPVRRYLELSAERIAPPDLEAHLVWTARRHRLQRAWAEFFETHDALIGPVYCAGPAMPLGADIADEKSHAVMRDALRLCTASTFVGSPAVAIPVGMHAGLPLGLQVISAPWREDVCLAVAATLEARLGALTPIDPALRASA